MATLKLVKLNMGALPPQVLDAAVLAKLEALAANYAALQASHDELALRADQIEAAMAGPTVTVTAAENATVMAKMGPARAPAVTPPVTAGLAEKIKRFFGLGRE